MAKLSNCLKSSVPVAASLAFLLLIVSCLRLPKPEPRRVSTLVVVLDLSASTTDVPATRCAELTARTAAALSAPGVRRLDVSALGTGDAGTGFEPVVLVPWRRFEPDSKLYEQPGRAEAARQEWLKSLAISCRDAVRDTVGSPVFLAVRRGAESVRAHCADLDQRREVCDHRWLAVHSDFRENVDPAILAHLKGSPEASRRPLPSLDVGGLELSLCGISVTNPGESFVDPRRVSQVWQQVFGQQTRPFDPSCPALGEKPVKSEVRL